MHSLPRLLAALVLLATFAAGLPALADPARQQERARLRQQLTANPGKWVCAERWIAARPGAAGLQSCQELGVLKAKQIGKALMVRSYIPQSRAGQAGFMVRDLIRQAPPLEAGAKHSPTETLAKESFLKVVKLASDEFVRERPQLESMYGNAMRAVEQATVTQKTGLYRLAMQGLASGLNDRWTQYFEPVQATAWSAHLRPVQVTCGFSLRQEPDGSFAVGGVQPSSAAHRAGLRVGDRVVSLDGQRPSSLQAARARLLGELGTALSVEINRGGARQALSVAREETRVLQITSALSPSGVGVVKLPKFYAGSAQELRQAITSLEQQRGGALRGLVIDVRGNGGGARSEWISMLREFLPDGSLGENRGQGGRVLERFSAAGQAGHPTLPLAVLVDGNSASASERLAGVLKDRRRALIVGAPTYGKDVGQTNHDLPDGSSFKVTNVAFHLPSGNRAGVIQPHLSSQQAREILGRARPGQELRDPDLALAVSMLTRSDRGANQGQQAVQQ